MRDYFWLAAVPTLVLMLLILAALLWWDATHPAKPAPTLQHRWEYGQYGRDIGSMDLDAERAWKASPGAGGPLTPAERARMNAEAAEDAARWREPRPGALVIDQAGQLVAAQRYPQSFTFTTYAPFVLPPGAPAVTTCPVCQARDDEPHGPECWLADEDDQDDNDPTAIIAGTLPPGMMMRLTAEREGNYAVWLAERPPDAHAALRATLRAAWDALASS